MPKRKKGRRHAKRSAVPDSLASPPSRDANLESLKGVKLFSLSGHRPFQELLDRAHEDAERVNQEVAANSAAALERIRYVPLD